MRAATIRELKGKANGALMRTRNDVPESVRKSMIALGQSRLADAIDLRAQIKQAHWNVRGPAFISLHKLFDELAAAVDEYADLVAERLVQLGGLAQGTIRHAAEHSALPDYPANLVRSDEHVRALADALASFGAATRAAIDAAQQAGDFVTADIYTDITRGIDKWLWFIEAHDSEPAASNNQAQPSRRRA